MPDFEPPPVTPKTPDDPDLPSGGSGDRGNGPDDSDNTPEARRKVIDDILKNTPVGITGIVIAVLFLILLWRALPSDRKTPRAKELARICDLLACACASFVVFFATGGVTHLGTGTGIATGIVEIIFLSLGNSFLFSSLFTAIRVQLYKFLIAATLVLLSVVGFTASGLVAIPDGIAFDAVMIGYNTLLLVTALIFWFEARKANKQDGNKFTHWSSKYLGFWLASAAIVLLVLAVLDHLNNPSLVAAAITGTIFDSDDISDLENVTIENWQVVLNFLLGKVITWGIATLTTSWLVLTYHTPIEQKKPAEKKPNVNLNKNAI